MQICITKDMIAKKAIDYKYLTVLKGLNKTLHGRTPAEAYNHLKEDFEHRVLTSPANNRQYSKLCEYPRHLKQINSFLKSSTFFRQIETFKRRAKTKFRQIETIERQ